MATKTVAKRQTTSLAKTATKAKAASKATVAKKSTSGRSTKSTREESTASTANKVAVLEISGTQLIVRPGEVYEVEKIDAKSGDTVSFDTVMLTSDGKTTKVGTPYVKGAKIELKVLAQTKGKKLKAFNYKAKSRYRRRWGYRPLLTRIEVLSIEG